MRQGRSSGSGRNDWHRWKGSLHELYSFCMGDAVSMIFFTVSDEYTQDFHTAPRITREIFCYKDNVLLQSRLYPTDLEDKKTLYRSIVQQAVATCLLILVHDLVKLLFEFVHHCNLTFLKFFIFNAGRRQTKMKKREQLFFVANSSTKVILALCEASPSGEKMPAMHRPDGQRHCRHKVQK